MSAWVREGWAAARAVGAVGRWGGVGSVAGGGEGTVRPCLGVCGCVGGVGGGR